MIIEIQDCFQRYFLGLPLPLPLPPRDSGGWLASNFRFSPSPSPLELVVTFRGMAICLLLIFIKISFGTMNLSLSTSCMMSWISFPLYRMSVKWKLLLSTSPAFLRALAKVSLTKVMNWSAGLVGSYVNFSCWRPMCEHLGMEGSF